MELEVRRTTLSKHSTIGKMAIDGQPQCFTLEPPKEAEAAPEGNGYVSIPTGTFPLTIRWSFKHQRLLPHVEEVPGRTAIEMHIGNYPRDTDGCTLVGTNQPQADFIGNSGVAFSALMTKLFAGSTLTNPEAAEKDQVWNVGSVTYTEV